MKKGYNMTRIEMMRRKINECLSENLMTNVTFEITSEVYSDSEEFTVVFAMAQYRATLLVSCVDTNTWVYHSHTGYCACSGSKYYRSIISVFRQMVNDIDDYKEMWEVVVGASETSEAPESEEVEETEASEVEKATETEDLDEYEDIIENEDIDAFIENENLDEIEGEYPVKQDASLPCLTCTHFCVRFDIMHCNRKNIENQREAIKKPEWHNVSLNTLANLDFDMLDEKRQLYLQLYRELKELIKDLHKCKSGRAYEKRLAKMYIRNAELLDENKISHDYINYFTRKVSMCNVECGLWTSKVEEATGLHKSRRYNRHVLKY